MDKQLNSGAYLNTAVYIPRRQDTCENYTPLHHAVEIGCQRTTRLLLKHNVKVGVKGPCGTALYIALKNGYNHIALDLLHYGAYVTDECTFMGYTLLHLASASGDSEIVRLLLNGGAEVDAVAKDRLTPLHIATEKGHLAIITLLLQHGANIDAENKDGMTVLRRAVDLGHSDIIVQISKFRRPDRTNKNNQSCLKRAAYMSCYKKYENILDNLLKCGLMFTLEDSKDWKLLHDAVRYGYIKVLENLLRFGADVNITDNFKKRTLLHTAAIFQQEQVTELLLSHGVDENAKDVDEKTPMFYAILNDQCQIIKLLLARGAKVKDDPDLLIAAVRNRSIEVVQTLLECTSDIEINGRDKFGRTALYYTAFDCRGCVEDMEYIARLLLARGASPNIRSEEGRTALHIAVKHRNSNNVEVLLEYGADVNSKSYDDTTPLHIAADRGYSEIAYTLIKFGADVNSIDAAGNTAFQYAFRWRHSDIIVALLQHGSDININSGHEVRSINSFFYPSFNPTFHHCLYLSSEFLKDVKIVVRHIAQLKAECLFVDRSYFQTIYSNSDLKRHYTSCEKEIGEMKNKKVGNTKVSFYDILTKNVHRIATYARHESIAKVFESHEYIETFPIYADLLKSRFARSKARQYLIQLSTNSFNSILGYELPYFIIDEIVSYLGNLDLKRFIDACSSDVTLRLHIHGLHMHSILIPLKNKNDGHN